MRVNETDAAAVVLGVAALWGIWLGWRARRRALAEVERLLADGINGATLTTARAGVRLEEFRIVMRLMPLIAAVWFAVSEPGPESRMVTASLWIAAQVIDDAKSIFWAGMRRLVVDLEQMRVRWERERR